MRLGKRRKERMYKMAASHLMVTEHRVHKPSETL